MMTNQEEAGHPWNLFNKQELLYWGLPERKTGDASHTNRVAPTAQQQANAGVGWKMSPRAFLSLKACANVALIKMIESQYLSLFVVHFICRTVVCSM